MTSAPSEQQAQRGTSPQPSCVGTNGRAQPLGLIRGRGILLVLLLTAALRVVLVVAVAPHPERYLTSDGTLYDELARHIADGRGFVTSDFDDQPPYSSDNFRTPIYPLYMAAHYALFGIRPDLVLFSQALLLEPASACLLFLLGRRLFGQRVGLVAATLFALSPISISYTALSWSETLLTLLILASVWQFVEFCTLRTKTPLVLSAVLLGLAALEHPRAVAIPIALTPFFFVWRSRTRAWWAKSRVQFARWSAVHLGLFAIVFAAVIGVWVARNYTTFGVPNLASVSDYNLLFYNAGLMESQVTGKSWGEVTDGYREEVAVLVDGRDLNPAQTTPIWRALGLQKIGRRPLEYLKVHLIGSARVLLPNQKMISLLSGNLSDVEQGVFALFITDDGNQDAARTPVSLIVAVVRSFSPFELTLLAGEIVFVAVTYLAAGYALWLSRRDPAAWLLVALIAYLIVIPGPAGTPRFRVPAMPYLVLLAAVGLTQISQAARGVSFSRSLRTEEKPISRLVS